MFGAILLAFAVCAGMVCLMSIAWLRLNEFHEWIFPEIRKISLIVCGVCLVLYAGWNITSRIKIHKEIQESTDIFMMAYEDYPKFVSKLIDIESDISEQIALLKSGSRRYGKYRAYALKADDQLRIELNKAKSGDAQVLESLYGTSDVKIKDVYVRTDFNELTDEQLKEQADNGGYEIELYYTDVNKRAEAEAKYRESLQDESLVKSYMAQFDTDRNFDVSQKFKVTLDSNENIVIGEDMKEFIKQSESIPESEN